LRRRTHWLIGEDEGCAGNDDRAHSHNKLLVDAGFLRHVGNVWIVRRWFAIDTNPFRTALVVPAIEGAKDVQAFDPDTSDRRASDFDAILFASPNGASNHTAPNAQAIAMMAAGRMSDAPIHRMTRIRLHYKRSVKVTPPYPMAARHTPKVQYPARSSSDDIELYDNHPFLRNGSNDRQAPTSGPH
jgi:hypothetical protein